MLSSARSWEKARALFTASFSLLAFDRHVLCCAHLSVVTMELQENVPVQGSGMQELSVPSPPAEP